MHILITKDGSTKIPREVRDLAEAHAVAATGFHVELMDEEGKGHPLPALDEPDNAGGAEEAEQLAEAPAPAKKVAAKKAR